MKRLSMIFLGFIVVAASCNSPKKENAGTSEKDTTNTQYSLIKSSAEVKFTAYKTTEKNLLAVLLKP